MRPRTKHPGISAMRTDALFASALQRSDEPTAREVRQAVAAAVRQFGSGGCAGRVAQEFGERPELAAARMRWARQSVADAFGGLGRRRSGPRQSARQRPGHAHRAA
jgi:hypothetical protein